MGLLLIFMKKRLFKNGEPVNLSKKEMTLLTLLLQKKNKSVSREEIYSAVWDIDEMPSELSLRVYIRNLRKIFGKHIVSISKVGYSYVV